MILRFWQLAFLCFFSPTIAAGPLTIAANAMPRDIERGKAAGFVAYLTKPLDVRHFQVTIDSLLKGPSSHEPG